MLAAMQALSESLTPSPVGEDVADTVVTWLDATRAGLE